MRKCCEGKHKLNFVIAQPELLAMIGVHRQPLIFLFGTLCSLERRAVALNNSRRLLPLRPTGRNLGHGRPGMSRGDIWMAIAAMILALVLLIWVWMNRPGSPTSFPLAAYGTVES